MDPQHRQFLEVAWEALENAGHPPEGFGGSIGVYAGCGMGSYFYFNLCTNPDLIDSTGMFLLRHTGNDKDFLSTRVSHILDLKGPSINVQTACSTSLVAVHFAAKALLSGECDMALAGGVTIELPQGRGYLFKEGEILSPGRALPRLRSPGAGHGLRLGRGRRGAAPARRRDRRRRPHLGRHQGHGRQQRRRRQGRLPGAERRRAGARDRRRASGRRGDGGHDRLRRMPRHRHLPRRSDRGRRPDRRVPRDHRGPRLLPDRLGQDQHRPPRHRRRRGEPDQGRARAASPADSAEPRLREPQSRRSISSRARSGSTTASSTGGRTPRAGRASTRSASAAPTPTPSSRRRRAAPSPRPRSGRSSS